MFSISIEPARSLVRVGLWGFMTIDEVAEFSRQEQRATAELGGRPGTHLLLIDTSGAVIQSQEVVAALRELVTTVPRKARRVAVVRGNSLTRMQAERILCIRDETAIFSTLDEAEAWLFATRGAGRASRAAPSPAPHRRAEARRA